MRILANVAKMKPSSFGTAGGSHEVKRRALSSTVIAGLATLVLGSAFAGFGADTAQAQGFFDRLFNPKYHRMQELRARDELLREKARTVRVSAPKFFTYKPDVWKRVSFAGLAEVKTAAVAANEDQANEGEGVTADTAPAVLTEFDKARPALKGLDFEMLPEVADALKAFYREHPDFLWIKDGNVNSRALSAKMALADADKEGLDPEDYKVDLPSFEKAVPDTASADDAAPKLTREKALMNFELTFSSAVLTYVLDAERGRVDPDRISGYHDLPRREIDLVAVLEEIKSKDNLEAYLVSRNPQNPQYAALKKELARLRAEDEAEDQIVIAPGTFLKAGGSSPEMKHIVAAIRKNGSDELKEKNADVIAAYAGEELYSPELVALVKDFQKENQLSADGIIGKNTIKGHGRRDQCRQDRQGETGYGAPPLAAGRPWCSPGLHQPAGLYRDLLRAWHRTAFHACGGGQEIQSDELLLRQDQAGGIQPLLGRSLFDHRQRDAAQAGAGIRAIWTEPVMRVSTVSGQQVSSSSVDWYAVASKQQSINVRQYPGASNALGQVKIMFPNKHHIYMHDTPSKSLFKKDVRAFSHGCIRLQDPKAMAAAVLGKSKDYVTGRINQGQNAQEDVTGDIPVYISYFTAWPNDEGTISYFDDIYDRDMYLLKALDITEKTREDARV